MFKKISSLINSLEKTKDKKLTEINSEFKKVIDLLFKNCPEIKCVYWKQYTPYFNGWKDCEFFVRPLLFRFYNAEYAEDKYHCFLDKNNPCSFLSPEKYMMCKQFDEFVRGNPGLMKDLFGDHCEITITADGIDVSECEHD